MAALPAHLAVLDDLRRTRLLVTPEELDHRRPEVRPSGSEAIDQLLGGVPLGRILELSGPATTGLALRVTASFTSSGRLAAWVDRPDALDPRTAAHAGVELQRLFWCRPGSRKDAVRAADALLTSRAFSLVVMDLDTPAREPDVPSAAWLRLSRDAEAAGAALLVLGAKAGTFTSAKLAAGRARARFEGEGPGRTFEGLQGSLRLERDKLGRTAGEAEVSLAAAPHFPGARP